VKIAMLIKNFVRTGGAERYAVELSVHMAQKGHEVHLFTQHWDPELVDGLIVHNIVRHIRRPSYMNSLLYALKVRKLLKKQHFDVIHSHQRTISHEVITMHHPCYKIGKQNSTLFFKLLNWLRRHLVLRHFTYSWLESGQFLCRNLKQVIAVSQIIKADILNHYAIDPSIVHVIYPGVAPLQVPVETADRAREDIRGKHGLTAEDTVILFVGSEFKRKGLFCAIQALVLLLGNTRLPFLPHLLVVGSGDPRKYRKLSRRLGVSGNVHFVGLSRSVEQYYLASDMFLLPTLSEPFGMAPLEAMATGLPVIVSKKAGISEILKHGCDALLLEDPANAHEITKAIVSLSERSFRLKLGQAAKKTATHFSWSRMSEEILTLYEDAVESSTTGNGKA
jgi:UDP-glucose:(heptosyl)LPS alpha-1,3-glucosyltransferase